MTKREEINQLKYLLSLEVIKSNTTIQQSMRERIKELLNEIKLTKSK